jgi:hypothetical protein
VTELCVSPTSVHDKTIKNCSRNEAHSLLCLFTSTLLNSPKKSQCLQQQACPSCEKCKVKHSNFSSPSHFHFDLGVRNGGTHFICSLVEHFWGLTFTLPRASTQFSHANSVLCVEVASKEHCHHLLHYLPTCNEVLTEWTLTCICNLQMHKPEGKQHETDLLTYHVGMAHFIFIHQLFHSITNTRYSMSPDAT